MTEPTQLETLFNAIDAINAQDPNRELVDGVEQPKELLYGQRMSARQSSFCPQAPLELQIACRAQHIKRWAIARSDYPLGRAGYKQWRSELGRFHGELTAALMAENGFSTAQQQRVKGLLQKKQLKRDAQAQALEDIICLVFVEFYLQPFAAKHAEDKLLDIIRKTWNKMSEAGHAAALQLPLPPALAALLGRALDL